MPTGNFILFIVSFWSQPDADPWLHTYVVTTVSVVGAMFLIRHTTGTSAMHFTSITQFQTEDYGHERRSTSDVVGFFLL